MDRALGPAVDQREDVAAALVRRGDEDVGIARIETTSVTPVFSQIFSTCVPGLAAVGRLVEAAVAARRPERTLRRDVDGVGVARVDDDAADVLGALEADVRPRAAAVVALVDAVAVGDRPLRVVLAGADPDDVRALRVERDPADRVRALRVEDRLPRRAAVGRLPDAAGRRADVEHGVVGRIDRDRHHAAGGDGRPDRSRAQAGEGVGGNRLRRDGHDSERGNQQHEQRGFFHIQKVYVRCARSIPLIVPAG